MPFALPAFVGGMPGGMELAVLFLIFLIFVIPVGLVLVGVAVLLRRGGSSPPGEDPEQTLGERLDRLEARLDEIQDSLEIEQHQDSDSAE